MAQQEKKYVGSGFAGQYENSANIEISIPKLAEALGIDVKALKACFLPLYDSKTKAFKSPAVYINKFTTKSGETVEELCVKIQTGARQGDVKRLNVTLNEFIKDPNYKPKEQQQTYTPPAQVKDPGAAFDAVANEEESDLPF